MHAARYPPKLGSVLAVRFDVSAAPVVMCITFCAFPDEQ